MFVKLLALALVIEVSVANLFGGDQRVQVRGKFICPSDPSKAKNVLVKLIDVDPGLDDKMAEGKSDANGDWSLDGKQNEISQIEPRLQIYHDCDDGMKPCQRKWKILIPDKYITKPKDSKPMDFGILNLEMRLPSEERDCLH